jgi:predicted aspartyl protease
MVRLPPVIGLAALALYAPAVSQPANTQQFDTQTQSESLPGAVEGQDVRLRQDGYLRMTVPVLVSGSGPYRFLIDTGADRTAISRDLATRLRLSSGQGTTLHSVTGRSEIGTANVPLLDLSAKQVRDIDAAILDAGNMGADGILGMDSLRSQRILFNFKRNTLTIVPAQQKVLGFRDAIVVTGRIRNGRLVLTKARADRVPATVVVDTGAQVSIGNEALRQKLGRNAKARRGGTVELISVTGEKLVGDYVFVRELEVGGVSLRDLAVVFTDSHAFRQMGLDREPALLLGMNALRGFEKVSIDFARRKLQVVPPENKQTIRALYASR